MVLVNRSLNGQISDHLAMYDEEMKLIMALELRLSVLP